MTASAQTKKKGGRAPDRLLMVAMELTMSLFGVLYAFPHVPSRLLNMQDEVPAWFSVTAGAPAGRPRTQTRTRAC